MRTKTFLLLAATLCTLSAQAVEPQASNSRPEAQLKVCIEAAEVARTVTADTLRANTFDPDDAFVKHTKPGSDIRGILVSYFGRGSLLRDVLISSAGFGASVMPRKERDTSLENISEFAYVSVRNQCVIDVMTAASK
jgi:hypothetical protein